MAELGSVINEMSSNLQEIILLSENMCSASKDFIRKTSSTLKHRKLSHNDINAISNNIMLLQGNVELLNQAVDYFKYYSIEKKTNE